MKVFRWGKGLAVQIPRASAKRLQLKEGDTVELNVNAAGHLEISRDPGQPTLSELVARITPQNRHPEISVGKVVGVESPEW